MRSVSDRDLVASPRVIHDPNWGAEQRHESSGPEAADLLAAMWRYRWGVLIPAFVGALIGFLVYSRTPETFKSATRLIVESDRKPILDSMTGDIVGGVPDLEIVRSQLLSDRVISMAYANPRMQLFHATYGDTPAGFAGVAHASLQLTTELTDVRSAQSLVFMLTFEHTNRELCEAAVQSFSDALQEFFSEKHKSSRSELIKLISVATEQLAPQMEKLELEHSKFRSEAPLAWNSEGEAINPHREQQLFLIKKKSELIEQLRSKSILLAAVESIANESKDPIVALGVIGQLLGVTITVPNDLEMRANLREGDAELAQLELDQRLVPLTIERNKFAAEFGDSHPTVKALDAELSVMTSELKRLVREQSMRIGELMAEGRKGGIDPSARAAEAVKNVMLAAKAEESLLRQQVGELESQIENEKLAAIELARYEQDNVAMLRSIDRTRELMDQLEEQMARVSLTEEEGGVRVIELTAPTNAYLVGPNFVKMLGIGTFLGLALGAGLALLLEKNANTFRDPDEISRHLGVPVLTHIPFFKGRSRKSKKDEDDPYKDLDPYLAAIHSPSSVAAEAIRTCRTSIFFECAGPGGKVIQVTSPLPGDGKSTIAGNLACSIAQSGKRVLAIDCDLRRPQLTDNFSLRNKPGLTDVLNGECEPLDVCHETPLATLQVMPSGAVPTNPAEALTLPEMGELLELLRDQYDFIVVDTPPLLVVTDASITASLVDAVVMAIRIRRKSKPNCAEALSILRAVGARVIGLVINNSDEAAASDGYKGYGYYRYGRYTNRYNRNKRNQVAGQTSDNGKRVSSVHVKGRGTTGFQKLPQRSPLNGSNVHGSNINGSSNGHTTSVVDNSLDA